MQNVVIHAHKFFVTNPFIMLLQRHTCSPSSNKPLKGTMEQKSHVYENPENIYKRLLMKVDKISEGLDEHSRLLKELEAEIKENNK